MQKKLIALAIAGLASSAAFAQSNVTVYGVVDVYASTAGATGGSTKTSVNSGGLGGSRIGFKGVEDLGNGLKALFTLEYSLAADADQSSITKYNDGSTITGSGISNGSAIGTARQQFVGLTGGFGTAVAGRLQTAGYDFSAATNVFHNVTAINPLDTVSPTRAAQAGGLVNSSSRANNAVAYISPSFGGVTIAVNHARLSESATPAKSQDGFANLLSATYVNGPLTVAAITTSAVVTSNVLNTTTNAAFPTGSVKESAVGASYDFGVAVVKASYLTRKVDVALGNTADKNDKAWQVSTLIPVTAVGKVAVGYAKSTVDTTAAADNSKSYSVAYLHSLSKRTTAYAGYQHVSNDSGAALGVAQAAAPTNGGSARAFMAGVRHDF